MIKLLAMNVSFFSRELPATEGEGIGQAFYLYKDWRTLVINGLYLGLSPLPVTVTTRIITFLVGDPYKPSFATVTGRGTTQLISLLNGLVKWVGN